MANSGNFIWEELLTTDTKSAATFYAKVAGLKTKPSNVVPSYTTFVTSGGPMGGRSTKSGKLRVKLDCCRASTARRCLRAGKPKHWQR